MEEIENQVIEITYKQWLLLQDDIKGLTIALILIVALLLALITGFTLMLNCEQKNNHYSLLERIKKLENTFKRSSKK